MIAAVQSVMPNKAELAIDIDDRGTMLVRVVGDWSIKRGAPSVATLLKQLRPDEKLRRVAFDTSQLATWDSSFVALVIGIDSLCKKHGIALDRDNLPAGAQRLLSLATATPDRPPRSTERVADLLTRIGLETRKLWSSGGEMVEFLGEAVLSLGRLIRGKARFRISDLTDVIADCGPVALPIVTLISFLIGLILAFVGAVQLEQFGAQIYVADLTTIAMTREMGAVMTGIIMAGRTGAAFAAQIGTMQVNEEIDALSTFGLAPFDFLVLPRMLALILMMPLLCVYADLVGILGGAVVGIGMLDLSVTEYVRETIHAGSLTDLALGIFKSAVFGVLIAVSGCLRGMQSGRSASAVGQAATSAVVTSIVLIITIDGFFAVLTNALGI
jgi:phospholipid/cholesterol/gamma-HCH transport system permease protein